MSNVLVIYYSYEGSTEQAAQLINKRLGYDLLALQPKKEMSAKGFTKFIFGGFQAMMKQKPELEPVTVDVAQYSTIILASPIWAGDFAPPIRTIVEDGWLNDKDIYYLYTHAGGAGKTEVRTKAALEPANRLLSCFGMNTDQHDIPYYERELIDWAKHADDSAVS